MHLALTVNIGIILLIASAVVNGTRRLYFPYSVGLVFAGVVLAWLPIHIADPVSPEGIYAVLLPPLIFEAALQIQWSPLRRELPLVLSLVFLGVPFAAAGVATGMQLVGWSWLGALIFGFLISATDPVSVIAMFKEQRVEPRLSLLVETESLLNDGCAAVGFAVLIAITNGAPADVATVASRAALEIGGGIGVGGS